MRGVSLGGYPPPLTHTKLQWEGLLWLVRSLCSRACTLLTEHHMQPPLRSFTREGRVTLALYFLPIIAHAYPPSSLPISNTLSVCSSITVTTLSHSEGLLTLFLTTLQHLGQIHTRLNCAHLSPSHNLHTSTSYTQPDQPIQGLDTNYPHASPTNTKAHASLPSMGALGRHASGWYSVVGTPHDSGSGYAVSDDYDDDIGDDHHNDEEY